MTLVFEGEVGSNPSAARVLTAKSGNLDVIVEKKREVKLEQKMNRFSRAVKHLKTTLFAMRFSVFGAVKVDVAAGFGFSSTH